VTLKELVAIADEAYPDGLVGAYFEDPDGEHGDTLARFVARELEGTFSREETDPAEQIATAQVAMLRAIKELEMVLEALDEAHLKEIRK
jgi:hypothetical protein